MVAAVYGGSRPAAIAVAAMGGLALLIFLISDLRVAGATGQLSESCGGFLLGAEAIPQGGFYLELAGLGGAGDQRDRPRDPDPASNSARCGRRRRSRPGEPALGEHGRMSRRRTRTSGRAG